MIPFNNCGVTFLIPVENYVTVCSFDFQCRCDIIFLKSKQNLPFSNLYKINFYHMANTPGM